MSKVMEDAYRFIGTELKLNPGAELSKLIEEAAQKFDLTPMQTEFLINKYILQK